MRVRELEELTIDLLTKQDHPEIESVTSRAADNAKAHTRVDVAFANGAHAYVMVRKVTGPRIPNHPDYELPTEAF